VFYRSSWFWLALQYPLQALLLGMRKLPGKVRQQKQRACKEFGLTTSFSSFSLVKNMWKIGWAGVLLQDNKTIALMENPQMH
jgi:hypothetical protein